MATLDRLDKNVVHEICTNQVVVTLHACVKELVENALDAGAKRLELRLRESGAELLEVSDDGHGIAAENWEKLAMRHATSKIREYDDISQKLSTFGFRGEALSAIAAMGDMTVCTRMAGDAAATLLTYDRFGKLVSQVPAARQVGTTVSVRELFKRLPVRHREFLRNAKAQVSASLRFIQAYAIAQPEIRFHVLAEKMRGHGAGRATLMSSSGTARGWRQAAAAVLGDAVLVDVESVELVSECGWTVSGLISKPTGGRRSRDMQLFFCNRRPIDPPKRVVKLINDTFHQYNSRMWPVIMFSFSASQNLVDVNVTPDKRTVFFHNEEELLKVIQKKLTELYAAATCEATSLHTLANFGIKSIVPQPNPPASSDLGSSAAVLCGVAASGSDAQDLQLASTQDMDCKTPSNVTTIDLDDPAASAQTPGSAAPLKRLWQGTESIQTPQKLLRDGSGNGREIAHSSDDASAPAGMEILTEFVAAPSQGYSASASDANDSAAVLEGLFIVQLEQSPEEGASDVAPSSSAALDFQVSALVPNPTEHADEGNSSGVEYEVMDYTAISQVSTTESGSMVAAIVPSDTAGMQDPAPKHPEHADMVPLEYDAQMPHWETMDGFGMASLPEAPAAVSTVQTTVSMAQLEAGIARRRQRQAAKLGSWGPGASESAVPSMAFPNAFSLSSLRSEKGSASLDEVAKFAASEEAGGSASADAQSIKFDKTCFSKMRVIGQFNLGFIIAGLPTNGAEGGSTPSGLQLFIIDQHASDEKFRFEALNVESKIDRQPLVAPHFLQLNPAQEQLAESHLEIFRLNGFEIKKDDSQPPGRRLQVKTLPTCQGLMFGDKDIHDLLYTLEQAESDQSEIRVKERSDKNTGLLDLAGHRGLWSSTALPRPPKVWKMLANRACRYAIMIGKALRVSEMEKVLSNLGTLQQPWNCPHGRPTMRHLIDTAAAWVTPPRPAPLAAELSAGPLPISA